MREDVQPPLAPAVDAAALTGAAMTPDQALAGAAAAHRSRVTEAATGVPARPDPALDPLLGTTLADRYRIDRRLGAGGMGAVYAGFHLALNKRVALKVIQPRLGADPTIAQRFVQEAHAASAIGHEHIVHITDLGTEGGTAFLVMEYLDGEDLAETLRREGPLPWQRVIHIGEQIAWALSAAHRQGIIHRDIKPANCYRVPREHDPDFIKVLDFGLAKVLADSPGGESLTGTGMLLGTPGYIAPELYRGLRADHRVDIYALGALMHKLLTGELPAMASGSGASDRLALLAAPGAVLAVLGRALAEAPDDRHATAQDLAQALRNIPRVSADAPTQLGPPGQSGTDLTTPSSSPSGSPTRDTSSAQAITLREPTPASFPSLFTVEHDGKRVRFYIGAPLIVVLLAGVAALIWWLTRPVSFIAQAQQEARVSINGGKAADAARIARARSDLPPGTADLPPGTADLSPGTAVNPPPEARPPATDLSPGTATTPASPPAAPPEPAPPPPVPEDLSPEPAPAPKPRKGDLTALRNFLTRKCAGDLGTLSYDVKLHWDTDHDGRVVPGTVASPDRERDFIACALRELRANRWTWKPDTAYRETLKLGEARDP